MSGPASYGSTPSYQGPPAERGGSGLATAALVLGILALVSSFTVIGGVLLGVLAVILGIVAVRGANRGQRSGKGMGVAGIVTGALGIVGAIALIAIGVSLLNSPATKNLRTCLKNANGNQQAVQQCNDQFRDQISK